MSVEAESIVELTIHGIAAGGDGVGRDESGRVVFVPLTAPGDRVRAELIVEKGRWARANVSEVVEQAPRRRTPPCPVYGVCGGCRLQHMEEVEQVEARRQIVEEALGRIGGLDIQVPELIQAGSPLEYRNRVTLSAGGGRVGFRRLDEPAAIVDVDDCLLAEPPIRSAVGVLAEVGGLPTGGSRRVTVRANVQGEIAIVVEGGNSPGDPYLLEQRISRLVSYWWRDSTGKEHLLAGEPTFRETWQGVDFDLPPRVFLQANRHISAAMDSWIDERVGDLRGRRVHDVFSGVGARAIRWAAAGAAVSAWEVDGAACAACRVAAGRAGVSLRVVQGRAEQRPDVTSEADLVVVNPPRRGLPARLTRAFVASSVAELVYVSCDPATLARDLGLLKTAYEVAGVQSFDAFPQTAHVETIALLVRRQPDAAH